MNRSKLDEKLNVNKYDVDKEVHIIVNENICNGCSLHQCVSICPAGCYRQASNEQIVFSYEGCLECGSCRIICTSGAINWRLPRGGFGICYEYG